MIRYILYISLALAPASVLLGQTNLELKKNLIDGVESFKEAELENAAHLFAAGAELEGYEDIAAYNRGRALMDTESHDEALSAFSKAIEISENSQIKSRSWYNAGNVNLMKGDIEKAIEAYKNSLRNDPAFGEARNNLNEAYKLLQQQQQEQQQEQQQDQNEDGEDGENQQDQQDQQDGEDSENQQDQQDQQDGEDGEDREEEKEDSDKEEEGDQQDQKDGEEDQQDQQGENGDEEKEAEQVKERQLSKEEMARILENLENEEEKIQARLMKQKGAGKKKTIEKKW